MQTNQPGESRFRRTVNDMVMAEMFMIQATIESAIVIGEGLDELGRQFSDAVDEGFLPWEGVTEVMQDTAARALEPFTTRLGYLRNLFDQK